MRGGGAAVGVLLCFPGADFRARGCSSMAEHLLPKQIARVRFPSAPPPAFPQVGAIWRHAQACHWCARDAPRASLVVATVSGVLFWRHSEAAAAFFARPGRRVFGDRLADRTYTSANVRWGAGGWVVFGGIALVSGLVGLVQSLI